MCHALIVDDNMIIGRAIQERLASLGFASFDHTWTEDQAVEAATLRSPDLVVIGDAIVGSSPRNTARRIATTHAAPILMITAHRCELRRRVPEGPSRCDPFQLSDLEAAVALARAPMAAAA